MRTKEELREYAKQYYRRKHNVPPERFVDGRSSKENREYHRDIQKRFYYKHRDQLLANKKLFYIKKKQLQQQNALSVLQSQGLRETPADQDTPVQPEAC